MTLRFESAFAFAAIIALLHDIVLTIGAFALFGRELSLIIVGAVLTIAGYSINDTIVVFDRIREEMKRDDGASQATIMNRAINETLSRTILTGGTTVLSTLALYFFGGRSCTTSPLQSLSGFSWAPTRPSLSPHPSSSGGLGAGGAKAKRQTVDSAAAS